MPSGIIKLRPSTSLSSFLTQLTVLPRLPLSVPQGLDRPLGRPARYVSYDFPAQTLTTVLIVELLQSLATSLLTWTNREPATDLDWLDWASSNVVY